MTLNHRKLTLALCLSLVGCIPSEQSEVAMVALIANASQYDQLKVKTFGFLKKQTSVRLFINREDAFRKNRYHSIKIDGLSNDDLNAIEACINQYVFVTGTINLNKDDVTFEDVQIKGSADNIYLKLVCNHNFN